MFLASPLSAAARQWCNQIRIRYDEPCQPLGTWPLVQANIVMEQHMPICSKVRKQPAQFQTESKNRSILLCFEPHLTY